MELISLKRYCDFLQAQDKDFQYQRFNNVEPADMAKGYLIGYQPDKQDLQEQDNP